MLIRRGVFTHTGRDIALQRINDVGFVQSLWDRMVGAGTLTIESAGEQGQEELKNIPHSDRVQQSSTTSSRRTPSGAPARPTAVRADTSRAPRRRVTTRVAERPPAPRG